MRAHVALNAIYKWLDEEFSVDHDCYEHYKDEMQAELRLRSKNTESVLKSLHHEQSQLKTALEKNLQYLSEEKRPTLKQAFAQSCEDKQKRLVEIQDAIKKTKEAQANPHAILAYERFVELFRETSKLVRKTTDLQEKDAILREIFSNLTMRGEEMTSYTLKPPFDRLVKEGVFRVGGDGRNRTAV